MFNAAGVVLQAIADTLQKEVANLQPYWTNIANTSQQWAYDYILQIFGQKGYTVSQIAGWDYGADWELNLSLWRALSRSASLQAVDDKLLQTMDVRKDLQELGGIIGGGVFQFPAGVPGTANVGYTDTSTDMFVWPDPYCPNDFPGPGIGQTTRF